MSPPIAGSAVERRTPPRSSRSLQEPRPATVFVASAALLAVVTVAVRLVLASQLHFCGTPDACYYLGMAQTLAGGAGFHARFLFDLQQAHPALPNSGIEYWRPGISLLLALFKPFGVSLFGSIVLTTLVGVLFAASAWHLAVRCGAGGAMALGSFALCLLSSYTWVGSGTPDSGLYYGAAVGWFLALLTVQRQSIMADLLALLCAGLAYLIRNDAVLLLVPLLTVIWARRRERAPGSSALYALLLVAGFALALLPMHLMYRAVLGTAFPPGTGRVLFLDSLSDFGRYRDPVTFHTLLAHGARHLVLQRVATLATVLYRVAVLMIGLPALIFLPGLLLTSKQDEGECATDPANRGLLPEWAGAGSFALAVLALYTLLLPAIGVFSALRSAMGLMPLASVLVMLAVLRSARSARMAHALMAAVVVALTISGFMEAKRDLVAADMMGDTDRATAAGLASLGARPASAVVLTGDPVQFAVTTGYSTVAMPSNGLDAMVHAAEDFRITHVILDSGNLPATPAELERRLHAVRSIALEPEHLLLLELRQTTPTP